MRKAPVMLTIFERRFVSVLLESVDIAEKYWALPVGFVVSQRRHRRNRLRFVYSHFKSCDQSLDKIYFDFSYIFRAMQSCAMCTKSKTIFKLPKGMVT